MRDKKGKFFQLYKVNFTSKRDKSDKRVNVLNKKYWTLKNNVFNIEYKKNKNTSLFSLLSLICERWLYGKKLHRR